MTADKHALGWLAFVLAATVTGCAMSAEQAAPQGTPGEAAIKQAAEAKKHLYILFYSEENEAMKSAQKALDATIAKMTDTAQCVALNRNAAAQKALVEKYELQEAPMPLVLVLAPNGAITMGCLAQNADEDRLRAAIASPGMQHCLKALQDNKVVVVCAYDKTIGAEDPSVKAVSAFHADAKYKELTEVVNVDPADAAEKKFMKQMGVDEKAAQTTIVLAPPRNLLKAFAGPVTKEMIESSLKASGG